MTRFVPVRTLRYQLTGKSLSRSDLHTVHSTRGASGFGDLDIAYIADRRAMTMLITDTGLPDYCLTSVIGGALCYTSDQTADPVEIGHSTGLIYRGVPGTRLSATDDHERLAIWIPAASLN